MVLARSWMLLVVACGDNVIPEIVPPVEPVKPTCDETNLLATLGALQSVTSVIETPCGEAVMGQARCFAIAFDQPVDHQRQARRFSQRLFLTHRGCASPNLVGDWGYSNDSFFDDELSVLYQTNSLWIEHRFQGESVPTPADWDWTQLTIENGANDMHLIVDSFRKHYGGRFVSTGASKGGVTATYHKFLFPDDLDGSIPYVAPASRDRIDPEYQTYLNDTLPSPCAQRVRDAQVASLTSRRAMMLQRLSTQVGSDNATLYLEAMIANFDWVFWQAYGVPFCNSVPTATTTDDTFFGFISNFSGFGFDAPARDEEQSYGALYYEWLTEQGFALQVGDHVAPHLVEPFATATMEENFLAQFPGVPLPAYDGSVTAAARAWARDEAEDLLLIYGQFDPWSGGAMEAPAHSSSGRFFVPGATHGAQIGSLDPADEVAALAHATRMFGRKPGAMKREAAKAGAHRQALLEQRMREQQAIVLRMRLMPAR